MIAFNQHCSSSSIFLALNTELVSSLWPREQTSRSASTMLLWQSVSLLNKHSSLDMSYVYPEIGTVQHDTKIGRYYNQLLLSSLAFQPSMWARFLSALYEVAEPT